MEGVWGCPVQPNPHRPWCSQHLQAGASPDEDLHGGLTAEFIANFSARRIHLPPTCLRTGPPPLAHVAPWSLPTSSDSQPATCLTLRASSEITAPPESLTDPTWPRFSPNPRTLLWGVACLFGAGSLCVHDSSLCGWGLRGKKVCFLIISRVLPGGSKTRLHIADVQRKFIKLSWTW